MKKLNIFISALVAGVVSTSPANAKIPFLSKLQTKDTHPANLVEANSSKRIIYYDHKTPITGTIKEIRIEVGDDVNAGDICVIIEAMKMVNELAVERPGTVIEIRVQVGQSVEAGQTLFRTK